MSLGVLSVHMFVSKILFYKPSLIDCLLVLSIPNLLIAEFLFYSKYSI